MLSYNYALSYHAQYGVELVKIDMTKESKRRNGKEGEQCANNVIKSGQIVKRLT